MDWRNRIGLYGSYFLAMAGIGFTLPYLPLYLGERGMSDQALGLLSTLAALVSLAQYPIGLWSDRLNRRKPFLLAGLVALAASTLLLGAADGAVWLTVLVVLFAENGVCRATIESLAGAEATHLAPPDQVGAALGALRFWRPVSIVLVALASGIIAERYGVDTILVPLAFLQCLALLFALLIHEGPARRNPESSPTPEPSVVVGRGLRDGVLWVFIAAMVLFHVANAPGGVYLGLFMKRDLGASEATLSYAFVVSMVAWMLLVWPAGWLADRWGRRPLLLFGWTAMTVRLLLLALVDEPWQVLAIQILDGTAQALFAVAAAAWVTDRLADPRRVGEAQVLVGAALVFGSALGPALAGLLVGSLRYRDTFGLLAAVGAAATGLVLVCVPETAGARAERPAPEPLPNPASPPLFEKAP